MAIRLHQLTLPEIFDRVGKLKTEEEQIAFLQANDSKTLRWFLYRAFHGKFDIKGRMPNFEVSELPVGLTYSNMNHVTKSVDHLLEGNTLSRERVERILHNVLESVHASEAKLIKKLLRSTYRHPKVGYGTFQQAFPHLLR